MRRADSLPDLSFLPVVRVTSRSHFNELVLMLVVAPRRQRSSSCRTCSRIFRFRRSCENCRVWMGKLLVHENPE
jgi:hypothetical protein